VSDKLESVVEDIDTIPKEVRVIGTSVELRKIEAHTYGIGDKHLMFVGGVHGGYEWNSVLLAYAFIDYFDAQPSLVPDGLTITVIPSLNPDGVYEVLGKEGRFALLDVPLDAPTESGRFNAHQVDLNRNFDCKWAPESMWRGNTVSAGTEAFSEPEADALRIFVEKYNVDVGIFWHSQAGAVYASACEEGIISETLEIMNLYAEAGGYNAVESFDAYEITGDAEGWLASLGIPAITIELDTHKTIEWQKNLKGVKALLRYYSK
jgi:hypothetical protein